MPNIYVPRGGLQFRGIDHKTAREATANVCLRIPFKGYVVSIACDDSAGTMKHDLARSDIRIYKDNATQDDVTKEFLMSEENMLYGDASTLMRVLHQIEDSQRLTIARCEEIWKTVVNEDFSRNPRIAPVVLSFLGKILLTGVLDTAWVDIETQWVTCWHRSSRYGGISAPVGDITVDYHFARKTMVIDGQEHQVLVLTINQLGGARTEPAHPIIATILLDEHEHAVRYVCTSEIRKRRLS